jgi:psiF repeat
MLLTELFVPAQVFDPALIWEPAMAASSRFPLSPSGSRLRGFLAGCFVYGVIAAGLIATTSPSYASQSANSQQQKMKACNTQASAKSLSGDPRKTFMSTCLSAKPAKSTTALNSQQEKMKSCNAQATSQKLTGDTRSKYVTGCLKG